MSADTEPTTCWCEVCGLKWELPSHAAALNRNIIQIVELAEELRQAIKLAASATEVDEAERLESLENQAYRDLATVVLRTLDRAQHV